MSAFAPPVLRRDRSTFAPPVLRRGRRRAAWLVVLVLVAAPPATAQTTIVDGVTEFDVNGLRVLVKRRDSSQTAVAGMFLRGGVGNVTTDNAGIEPLMFDVAAEATAAYPRERMRRELARIGASLSFGTTRDYSALTMATPRRDFDAAWTMFVETLLRPSFAAEDFERSKTRRLAALSAADDTPDAFIGTLQARAAFVDHPYANDPDGTPASVARLSLDALRRYHRQMMVTSRLLLVVVGNVDVEQVRRKAQAAFGTMPRGDYVARPVTPLRFTVPSVAVTARPLPTNYVSGLFVAPPPGSADFDIMRVATAILRDWVFDEVRTKRNLSYAPDAFLNKHAANAGGLYFTSVDANQTVQVMLGEIARLQTAEVPAGVIRATGQGLLTNAFLEQETNSAQAGWLALHELVGGGWREAGRMIDRVRAVTPADVRRVANTYMRNLQFVVLGDPSRIDRQVFTRNP